MSTNSTLISRSSDSFLRTFSALITAFVVLGMLLMTAAPAFAHDGLASSDPAEGSAISALPASITLTYSAAPQDAPDATKIEVIAPSGADVATGAVAVEGNVMTQALDTAANEQGKYTVRWANVSSDGHSNSGEFTFTVGDAASDTSEHATDEATSPWLWVLIGGALLVAAIVLTWLSVRAVKKRR